MTAFYTTKLPHGEPQPVGDRALWDQCVDGEQGDTMQRYADARGLTRQQAKNETYILRFAQPMKFPEPMEELIQAGIREFLLDHDSESAVERRGRRAAIRGLMVRLNLYSRFNEALAAVNHDEHSRQAALDRPVEF